jgi:hypothetical protein
MDVNNKSEKKSFPNPYASLEYLLSTNLLQGRKQNTRSGVHNSSFNTTLLGPKGRQMHEEPR